MLVRLGAAVVCASEVEKNTLVECGEFVKIYDPSVGEDDKWYINDHCFIYGHEHTWHLFGITRQEPAMPLEEINFAHATAKTLLQQPWSKQPFALTVAKEPPCNEVHLWAPHVIGHRGIYYMYYCAGDRDHTMYKIHLATSRDLKTWTRHPKNPMIVDGFDARDPFILRVKNKWVMYYTANSSPNGGNHVVACVMSNDLITWDNRGVVFTDPKMGTYGGPTESPFVVRRGERFYLFIGPRHGYDGTDVFVSDDPFHWKIDNKVGHFKAHAAEVVRDGNGKWYISRCGWERGGVYLAPLIWKDGQREPKTNIDVPAESVEESGTIGADTVKLWSAPYRGWHYYPDRVILAKPDIKGFERVHTTDVPTVFQLPGDKTWYMTFIGFDGKRISIVCGRMGRQS
ncbi:MAG: family 43 glycosylhydrolase [Phycisphaerae bacterium]|nr:family 43 glycosylhydrolase [Phycisphaerae bacterium]